MRHVVRAAALVALVLGCEGEGPLDPTMCSPGCVRVGPDAWIPAGFRREDTCYDGCNWCQRTRELEGAPCGCTARACPDAGR